jgi:hypothetical protein
LLALVAWWKGWSVEWRIEGDMLAFRATGQREFTSIPIDDIEAVVLLSSPSSDFQEYEFVVRGRPPIRVSAQVFEPLDPFEAAIRNANPSIQFARFEVSFCPECQAPIRDGSMRCPACRSSTAPDHGIAGW